MADVEIFYICNFDFTSAKLKKKVVNYLHATIFNTSQNGSRKISLRQPIWILRQLWLMCWRPFVKIAYPIHWCIYVALGADELTRFKSFYCLKYNHHIQHGNNSIMYIRQREVETLWGLFTTQGPWDVWHNF